MSARLTETQPAVEPAPLACRKIAEPRRVSALVVAMYWPRAASHRTPEGLLKSITTAWAYCFGKAARRSACETRQVRFGDAEGWKRLYVFASRLSPAQ